MSDDGVWYDGWRIDHCAEHWANGGSAGDGDDDKSRWIGVHDRGTLRSDDWRQLDEFSEMARLIDK